MPTGSLPAAGKKIFEEVYAKAKKTSCKDEGDRMEECAARIAWKAVKNAGYYKDKEGKWHKRSLLSEFSLRIVKAGYDEASGEMRWRATASDIDEDSYGDNMTHELFEEFISKINDNSPVPENYKSDFWSGGMPYLSVSHYPDLDGKAVPGISDSIYIDGACLKAKGRFTDTLIGRACFRAVCDDLYKEERKNAEDKIRISIAFLDYGHKHKSNGFVFERNQIGDFCPECLKELINGEYSGKEFMKGHLIHLALTRVPVNKRTSMEVDKSMTTRKEDAASIIGEELAEELENTAKLVGKSEVMDALVIKAEDEDEVTQEGISESDTDSTNSDTPSDTLSNVEEEKSEVVPVEVVNVVPTQEYEPYKPYGGVTSLKDAKAAIEAREEVWRISDLWNMLESVVSNIMSCEEKDKAGMIKTAVNEFKDLLEQKSFVMEMLSRAEKTASSLPPHVLDTVFNKFKGEFDSVSQSDLALEDRLQVIQNSYAELGKSVVDVIKKSVSPPVEEVKTEPNVEDAITRAMSPLFQKLDLLITQLSSYKPQIKGTEVPARRSIQPTPEIQNYLNQVKRSQSSTPKLREIIERTT